MQLHSIDTGFFKLDGGAMFGVVPKVLWSRWSEPDAKNLCTWAMRCLLIEEGDRLILVDCGIGNKQSEKFFKYFEPHGEDDLVNSLKMKGFHPDDVTDVLLTHLHFDHCGGAVYRDSDGVSRSQFKNAKYWSHEEHWNNAMEPNPREKASFLKENFLPIKENGQLNFLNNGQDLIPGVSVQTVSGHTECMMLPHIQYKGKTLVYMADLLPSAAHIPLPYVMAYDVQPLETMKEKQHFLELAEKENHVLFFEHDKEIECCTTKKTEKGIRLDQTFPLLELS